MGLVKAFYKARLGLELRGHSCLDLQNEPQSLCGELHGLNNYSSLQFLDLSHLTSIYNLSKSSDHFFACLSQDPNISHLQSQLLHPVYPICNPNFCPQSIPFQVTGPRLETANLGDELRVRVLMNNEAAGQLMTG